MSPNPSRNRGAAETSHLTEKSFDEVLVATEGLVDRVLGAAPKAVLQSIVNARA